MTGGPELVDLAALPAAGDGVAWSASPEGVNVNLVALGRAGSVGSHRNDEVDVLLTVVAGSGTLTVDGAVLRLTPAVAVLVPRGARRGVTAGPEGIRYLTVHRARGPLQVGGKRLAGEPAQ
jgi:quercetin dioxygenase-like cupin family protein